MKKYDLEKIKEIATEHNEYFDWSPDAHENYAEMIVKTLNTCEENIAKGIEQPRGEKMLKLFEDAAIEFDKTVEETISDFFEEKGITDLMDYGIREGLLPLDDFFKELLGLCGINVEDVHVIEGFGDGKYDLTIEGAGGVEISLEVKAWNTPEQISSKVIDMLESVALEEEEHSL
jgi:hypothetical protein